MERFISTILLILLIIFLIPTDIGLSLKDPTFVYWTSGR